MRRGSLPFSGLGGGRTVSGRVLVPAYVLLKAAAGHLPRLVCNGGRHTCPAGGALRGFCLLEYVAVVVVVVNVVVVDVVICIFTVSSSLF